MRAGSDSSGKPTLNKKDHGNSSKDDKPSTSSTSAFFPRSDPKNEESSPLPISAMPYIYPAEDDDHEYDMHAPSNRNGNGPKPLLLQGDADGSIDVQNGDGHKSYKNERHVAGFVQKKYEIPSASETIRQATMTTSNYHSIDGEKSNSSSNQVKSVSNDDEYGSIKSGFSARVVSSTTRIDPCGKPYTAYAVCVEKLDGGKYNIEHRYSDFHKLYSDLKVNGCVLKSSFPNKSLAGRIGQWTPSLKLAPDANRDLIQRREKMLDQWMSELCETMQQQNPYKPGTNILHGELRNRIHQFLLKSSVTLPPCDKSNHIDWDGLLDSENDDILIDEKMKRADGIQKFIGNPISFSLSSSIRQAAYTVLHMCRNSNMHVHDADKSIPLDLLQNARGLVFLTVIKAGMGVSMRCGTGLLIARKEDDSWSAPVALGAVGFGWGLMVGGDITNYMLVLNTDRAVKTFSNKRSVTLGGELSIAAGPVGRSMTANINVADDNPVVGAYAYAHSKGFFAGISFEGSVVSIRPEVNAKFYGCDLTAEQILYGDIPRPLAALPLYEVINDAMRLEIPDGFRPSEVLFGGRM
ncbi:hypothetical protein CTEN210_16914 [Chaetoceros tenuissimus]|uniref:PX domain-containing protein n=1 Tax=Chaetoceros tenuissimus TaxID=426638 RepID=A0AAD3HEV9_9STRA|nr:hypothetical protein CTEN210_16914 [Chaetoceros tenuissimus]